ncbi:Chorismate synthase [anaerobic digester metagenome]
MLGSQHNDAIRNATGKTFKNGSGGINGGITNGNDIIFRVAVKPTSSISIPQNTFNFDSGRVEELVVTGRHDTCFALRVPVIVEAAAAVAIADLLL